MKTFILLTLLVALAFGNDTEMKMCGYSMHSKQLIWDCIKRKYSPLFTYEYCMRYLGIETGAEFLNNKCGPTDVTWKQEENFERCIKERIPEDQKISTEEEKQLFRACLNDLPPV